MAFAEAFIINKFWGTPMNHDFLLGTYFFGVGVAMIALSDHVIFRSKMSCFLGPLVLGIYAIHFLFIDIMLSIGNQFSGNVTWKISYPVAVFILSSAAVYLMSLNRWTKRMVA